MNLFKKLTYFWAGTGAAAALKCAAKMDNIAKATANPRADQHNEFRWWFC